MITGVILTHNEEANVVPCIKHLRPHVAEIILVDTESTDRTVELAGPLVDKVLPHPHTANFDSARNIAIPAAKFDWLWFVDADEHVPEATGMLVNRLIREGGNDFEAISIPFKSYFCGQWMQNGPWWPGYTCPRVLKRGHFEFAGKLHGGISLNGRTVRVPPEPELGIDHYSYRDMAHWLEKCNRYTSTEASQLADQGAAYDWRASLRGMVHDLWTYYELHQGRLDGERGWILAWLAGQYRWFSLTKLIDHDATPQRNGISANTPADLDEFLAAFQEELAVLRAQRPTPGTQVPSRRPERGKAQVPGVAAVCEEVPKPIPNKTSSNNEPPGYGRLKKSVLIQMAQGEHEVLLHLIRDHHERYAKRHGLDYWCITGNPIAGKRAGWGKIPLIRTGISMGYENVVWLDADAVIVRPEVNLAKLSGGGVSMVQHPNPRHWNTGMIVSHADVVTERFWREVDSSPENHSCWMEQLAVNELAARGDYAFLFHALDLSFNSVPGIVPADNPVVVAAHGLPQEERQAILFDAILTCQTQANPRKLPTIVRREDFGDLLNYLGLVGEAVEVGVLRGEFSQILLDRWRGRTLHLVDPWRHLTQYEDVANVSDADHEANFAATQTRLSPHQGRYSVLRELSTTAARQFPDSSLDFVYLDANHSFEKVWQEMHAWFPKLRPGGILAGHDFVDGNLPEGRFGVASAVLAFQQETGLQAKITSPPWPSWYLLKPGGPSISTPQRSMAL